MSKTAFLSILKVVCFVSGQNCVSLGIRTILIQVCAKSITYFDIKPTALLFCQKNVKFNIRESENL